MFAAQRNVGSCRLLPSAFVSGRPSEGHQRFHWAQQEASPYLGGRKLNRIACLEEAVASQNSELKNRSCFYSGGCRMSCVSTDEVNRLLVWSTTPARLPRSWRRHSDKTDKSTYKIIRCCSAARGCPTRHFCPSLAVLRCLVHPETKK